MKLAITTSYQFSTTPEFLFDFTNDAANFSSFVGFGPIPGIRNARYETTGEAAVGSRRRVVKSDGTEHVEKIVELQRPVRHVSRITELSPPFSWLVRYGEDDWRFRPSHAGTLVQRTFTFELTTPLAAIAAYPLLRLFMRSAIHRDFQNIDRLVQRSLSGRGDR